MSGCVAAAAETGWGAAPKMSLLTCLAVALCSLDTLEGVTPGVLNSRLMVLGVTCGVSASLPAGVPVGVLGAPASGTAGSAAALGPPFNPAVVGSSLPGRNELGCLPGRTPSVGAGVRLLRGLAGLAMASAHRGQYQRDLPLGTLVMTGRMHVVCQPVWQLSQRSMRWPLSGS